MNAKAVLTHHDQLAPSNAQKQQKECRNQDAPAWPKL
jgi:hypothetical protein